jgi:hypothetical protein
MFRLGRSGAAYARSSKAIPTLGATTSSVPIKPPPPLFLRIHGKTRDTADRAINGDAPRVAALRARS